MSTAEGGPDRKPDPHTESTAPPAAEEEAAAAQAAKSGREGGPKPPSWRLLIGGLVIALVMTTIMATTYISANHAVVAHNLPWGVTGQSSLTTAVQKDVSLKIHNYASESDLINAANHTTIYGGFVPQTNTLIISEAASLWAPGVMPAAYEKAAKAQGVKLGTPKVVNKLPKQDPEGVVPGLVVFVLLVAGYLASTLAMQRTGTAAAQRRVISLVCYAVVASLVFNLIVGPILGAYPDVGSNFWPLWGEFALMCLAVALLAATLQSVIGPIGTLVTVVVVVFFGNPSTAGKTGPPTCPPSGSSSAPSFPPGTG